MLDAECLAPRLLDILLVASLFQRTPGDPHDPKRSDVGAIGGAIGIERAAPRPPKPTPNLPAASVTDSASRESSDASDSQESSERRFRRIFEHSTDVISITSLESGQYFEVNDAFLKSSGFSREEVIGKTPQALGIIEDLTDFAKLVKQLLRDGVVRNREFTSRGKDGSLRMGLLSVVIT